MRTTGSAAINILREHEQKMRLRFWRLLARWSAADDVDCPFTNDLARDEIPFGVMPRYLRGAFVQALRLRSEERRSEAVVYEEAINDLLQEHFRWKLRARQKRGESPLVEFHIGKDWSVSALPLRRG